MPEIAIVIEPLIDGLEGLGVEPIKAVSAASVLHHQTRFAELTQVFRNRGTGNRESLGDLPGGLGSGAKQVEHGSAGGIGEGVKRGFRRICNRTVPHNA